MGVRLGVELGLGFGSGPEVREGNAFSKELIHILIRVRAARVTVGLRARIRVKG